MHNFLDFEKSNPDLPWLSDQLFKKTKGQELPSTRHEAWRYTSLRPVQTRVFQSQAQLVDSTNILPAGLELSSMGLQSVEAKICFLNGRFIASQNIPSGVNIKRLVDLEDEEKKLVLNIVETEHSSQESHFFETINRSLCPDGVYLQVEPNTAVSEPIELVYLYSDEAFNGEKDATLAAFPRVVIDVSDGSSVQLYETSESLNETYELGYLTSPSCNIYVGEKAHLAYLRIQMDHESAFSFCSMKADVKGKLDHAQIDLGAKISRAELNVNLISDEAEARVNGLLLTTENQQKDHRSHIHHHKTATLSHQIYKTIAGELGKASFSGCIQIEQSAPKSNASQLSRNLMLHESAEVNSQPQLKIHNDDVKCSHGAAYSKPSEEEIFYFLSRGINRKIATNMLSMAFADEVLLDFDPDTFRQNCMDEVYEKIHKKLGQI